MKDTYERTDDITIEEEATEQEVRPRLEVGHIVPEFRLRTVDGSTVQATDYKEKKSLVLLFFDIHNSSDWAMLAEIKRRYPEIADANAEVLAISTGPIEELKDCVDSMKLPFPLLCDCDRETACTYCVSQAMIFAADRYGELKLQEAVSEDNIDSVMNSVVSTLELAELECPECGVSTWPQF